MDEIEAIRSWREQNGCSDYGGVVVLHQGTVAGWVNMLRNPEHWQPGCVAVDEEGRRWTALGGNDQDGASVWQPNSHIPE